MLKKLLIISIFSTSIYAEVISIFLENDFIANQDRHYTNGFSLSYLSNKNTNDLTKHDNMIYDLIKSIPYLNHDAKYQSVALTFNHLIFTPTDTSKKEKIVDDLPYAGVATLNFSIYKWSEKYFHEYGITFGLVGPSTRAKELQNGAHATANIETMKGWDNQLKDNFLYGVSYSYGYKAFEKEFIDNKKLDITNTLKVAIGNGFRNILVGSILRYGKNVRSNFTTVGSTFGGNRDSALGLEKNKKFGWALNYGLYYTYMDYFYISDYDKSYSTKNKPSVLAELSSLDFYSNTYKISLTYKSSHFFLSNNEKIVDSWGGLTFHKIF